MSFHHHLILSARSMDLSCQSLQWKRFCCCFNQLLQRYKEFPKSAARYSKLLGAENNMRR